METNNSNLISDKIKQILSEDNGYYFFEDEGLLHLFVKIDEKIKGTGFAITPMENEFAVYGVFPLHADTDDKDTMLSLAEFICRANYDIINMFDCNIIFNMDEGEIFAITNIECTEVTLTKDMLFRAISNVRTAFTYFANGIEDVMHGNMSVGEAMAACEDLIGEDLLGG